MHYVLLLILLIVTSACTTHYPAAPQNLLPQPSLPSLPVIDINDENVQQQLILLKQPKRDEFVLGNGDVLAISVYGEPDLTVDGVPVRPDGRVSYPLIGDIPAKNLTVEQLRKSLSSNLAFYLRKPKVSVIVRKFNSLQYTIVGQVVKPGIYPLNTDISITQALARSGGLTQGQFHASSVELADLSHAFISRKGEMLPIDFVALFRRGDMRFDIPVHPGDYLYIPSGLSQEVYILGEVGRPDMFAFREGMPLSKALVAAKGFSPTANLKQIHLIRGSLTSPKRYVIDLTQVLAGSVPDVVLQPGDIIYVPPQGIVTWSRIINNILPGLVLARTGFAMSQGVY